MEEQLWNKLLGVLLYFFIRVYLSVKIFWFHNSLNFSLFHNKIC
jgi:hypothetical protein